MNVRKSVWYSLVPAIVLMLLQQASSMFGMQILMIQEFAKQSGSWDLTSIVESMSKSMQKGEFSLAVTLGYTITGIVIFSIWYRALASEKNSAFTHQDTMRGCSAKLYFGIILLAIAMQYLSEFIFLISIKAFPEWLDEYMVFQESVSWPKGGLGAAAMILYVVILGPIAEELCFRGLTYSLARNAVPHWSANILQALVFSGLHSNPVQALYAFFYGLILGDVVGKTGNLYISILMHIGFNGFSYILDRFIVMGDGPVSFFFILLFSMTATYYGYKLVLAAGTFRKNNDEAV